MSRTRIELMNLDLPVIYKITTTSTDVTAKSSEIGLPASRLGVHRAGELAPNFRVNNDFRDIARTQGICFHACRGIAGITKRLTFPKILEDRHSFMHM